MVPRRWRSPADDLRAFIATAVAKGVAEADATRAHLALAEMLTAHAAPPPPGMALTVVRWMRTATQLAAAVAAGALSAPNHNQARHLLEKWQAVNAAVEGWTDGGRREPAAPSPET